MLIRGSRPEHDHPAERILRMLLTHWQFNRTIMERSFSGCLSAKFAMVILFGFNPLGRVMLRRVSPGHDRNARWRTDAHRVELAEPNSLISMVILVDSIARQAIERIIWFP